VHSDEAAASAGKEHARCDSPRRSRRATGRSRGVLAHFLESELSAVEHQHAAFADKTLRLYTDLLQLGANLVKLVLAEVSQGNSLASDSWSARCVDRLVWDVSEGPA
jgi:hypothetical protein